MPQKNTSDILAENNLLCCPLVRSKLVLKISRFLDEYYKKFEDRVLGSQVDKNRGNERMDKSSGDITSNSIIAGDGR